MSISLCESITSIIATIIVQVHEFSVVMTCEGCSGAVNRVLGRVNGKSGALTNISNTQCVLLEVSKVDIDMEGQKVKVESSLSGEELLAILKKTGRECSYIGTST